MKFMIKKMSSPLTSSKGQKWKWLRNESVIIYDTFA